MLLIGQAHPLADPMACLNAPLNRSLFILAGPPQPLYPSLEVGFDLTLIDLGV